LTCPESGRHRLRRSGRVHLILDLTLTGHHLTEAGIRELRRLFLVAEGERVRVDETRTEVALHHDELGPVASRCDSILFRKPDKLAGTGQTAGGHGNE
jgi:hypothetical protein